MPRIAVFDLETRKGPKDFPGLSEQEGWDALRRGEGGISALALWDQHMSWPYLYDDTEIELIARHLEACDCVVGYASAQFDRPVVEGVLGRRLALREHVDLLELIWSSIRTRNPNEPLKGYKLEEVAIRCLGQRKLEKGAHAPVLASNGQWARLFRYALDDVRLTTELLRFIQREGGVVDAGGGWLRLDLPTSLRAESAKD